MIKQELDFVYITSDGKKFLSKDKANKHEKSIQPKDIVGQWLSKINGGHNES